MTLPNHQRHEIENSRIGFDLLWKAGQCITITLQFVSVHRAVHYGNIGSARTVKEAKFFNDNGIRIVRMENL